MNNIKETFEMPEIEIVATNDAAGAGFPCPGNWCKGNDGGSHGGGGCPGGTHH